MTIMPHNHRMWAVIGIYTGREDNIFWSRLADEPGGRVEAAGAKSLGERDAEPLGRDIIHSVTNPLSRLTGAIDVYGGDFFAVSRSEWDPETLLERNYDMEKNLRLFEDANRVYANWNLSSVSASSQLFLDDFCPRHPRGSLTLSTIVYTTGHHQLVTVSAIARLG